jgi:vitamin B12 transporter
MKRHLPVALLLLSFSLIVNCFVGRGVFAQAPAKLTGVITDPSGRAVSGARVIATQLPASGVAATKPVEAISNDEGKFEITLPPGKYRIQSTQDSFKRVEREIEIVGTQPNELDFHLQIEPLAASVVVTAQASPVEVEETSAPVTEATKDEIDASEMTSLPDFLATMQGFSLARTGPEGGQATLFVDGGSSNYAKVLMDGIPVNDSGGFMDFSNFTLDNVDKIEVVHGAESAIYGSDAMTGAIQLLTHQGDSRTPELDLTGDGGSFDTGHGAGEFSGVVGKFDYSAGASYFSTAGQGPNDGFLNRTFSGNFGYKFSDTNSLRFTLQDDSSFAGIPGQTLYVAPDLAQKSILHDFFTGLTWNVKTGNHWMWHVEGTESSLHSTDSDVPNFISTSQFNRASFDGQGSYLFRQGGITAGYYYEVEDGFPGALSGEHARRNNQAGYLDARWQPIARLTLNAGARAEDNASFGTSVVPRAGATYLLREKSGAIGTTRLHGFYGQGIDEPRLDQSFGTDPCFPGDPNLAPEQSQTANAGLDQQFAEGRVRVTADYFYNEFRDVISFAFLAPTGACPFGTGTYFNTDLAIARGVNLSADTKINRWISISGHYTFDNSRVLIAPNASDPSEIAGNHLFRRPVNSGTIVLNAAWRRAELNIVGYIIGQRTDSDFLGLGFTSNPGYSRFDVAASYRVNRVATLFIRAGNVLDRQYQDALGYPALGREVRGGVKLKIGGNESR